MIPARTTEIWGRYRPNPLQVWAIDQSERRPQSLWGSLCRRLVVSGLRQPLDVRRFGAKFRLYPTDNLCEKRALLSSAKFDRVERDLLSARMHPKFKFVDIGANIGLYSLFVAAEAGPLANILAVEPQPVIQERLAFNIAANPTANIVHVDCAVSDKKGVERMGLALRNRGASGFVLRSGKAPDDVFMVETRALAELLTTYDMLGADALKMDIEGAEELVLPKYFAQTKPDDLPKLLILERNPAWKTDCIALAEAHGYRQIASAHMNVVLEKTNMGSI